MLNEITAVAKKPGSEKESEPVKLLPSTGGQLSAAPYAGGLLIIIGLLFMLRSKRKYN
ncbi:LPXTG cell wall anchor domain-containing protein [Bacillus clarus]|uniref:LPXTG cell wall anchor domain-containing protein n=1 Tax=Bacillus clarus TaxID=2338372 RepID=A0ABX9L0M5_9BACI|nr:LPXTG cell wall anchor domain-containing protein [Bacillus clarus]